jgi:hypothetical protein
VVNAKFFFSKLVIALVREIIVRWMFNSIDEGKWLSLVHICLWYVGWLLSLAVQPNNSQKNDRAGIPQVYVNQA